MKFQPRYYQEEAAPEIFKYWEGGGRNPILGYPTGSGKTVVIADFISKVLTNWPKTKILVVSHIREIIEQDYSTLSEYLPDMDIGIYSAGLKQKRITQLTIGGIQSVARNLSAFEDVNLIIVDEAHLISPKSTTMYRKLFASLPSSSKIVGFTATPYRLGQGYIFGQEDSIFHSMIVDYTSSTKFNELVDKGYLCNLKTIATNFKYDTQTLHTRGGEYIESEMSIEFDRDAVTSKICDEIIRLGENRDKWLIFAIDIDHAEHIAEYLIRKGIPTNVVHSRMEDDRAKVIRKYKTDTYKCLVNVNILTTGFDHRQIDLIALMRPTQSPVLHVQMIGRGLRVHEDKTDCLILDFAGNTARLGPINDITPNRPKKGAKGEPITKECPECDPTTIHHPRAKICEHCGYEFPISHGLGNAIDAPVIADVAHPLIVDKVSYSIHNKPMSPASVKVSYQSGFRTINEWVCPEHRGWAGHKAKHWIKIRAPHINTADIKTAADLIAITEELNCPKEIIVKEAKYPEIIKYVF